MKNRSVAADTSGSWRRSHSSLGPTAWLVSGERPMASTASSP
jgi:hypothetical protein